MTYEAITIEDCLDNKEKRGKSVLLHNGQVIEFVAEDKSESKMQNLWP